MENKNIIEDKLENFYKEYNEIKDSEISEEEYNEIMDVKLTINDFITELIKYGRFINFSQKHFGNNNK